MNMEKSVRVVWGTLLTSKVADNFLGVGCLMTGGVSVCVICIFHDKPGDETHFRVLNGGTFKNFCSSHGFGSLDDLRWTPAVN